MISKMFFNLIKPICALCGKEVDELLLNHDFQLNKIIITAYCHDDKDSMSIDSPDVPFIDFQAFEKGYAFDKKLLGETKLLEEIK
jgi:hypothetical protein